MNEHSETYLFHYGTKGQKKGVRRYQNLDGSYTPLGRIHYGIGQGRKGGNVTVLKKGGALSSLFKKSTSSSSSKAPVSKEQQALLDANKKLLGETLGGTNRDEMDRIAKEQQAAIEALRRSLQKGNKPGMDNDDVPATAIEKQIDAIKESRDAVAKAFNDAPKLSLNNKDKPGNNNSDKNSTTERANSYLKKSIDDMTDDEIASYVKRLENIKKIKENLPNDVDYSKPLSKMTDEEITSYLTRTENIKKIKDNISKSNTDERVKYSDPKNMSLSEMSRAVDQMKLEKQYKEMLSEYNYARMSKSKKLIKSGLKFTTELLKPYAKEFAKEFVAGAVKSTYSSFATAQLENLYENDRQYWDSMLDWDDKNNKWVKKRSK